MKMVYLFVFTLLFSSFQLHAQFDDKPLNPSAELNTTTAPWENNSVSAEPYSASQNEPTTTTSSFWGWLYCVICKKLKHSGNCNPTPPPPTTPVPLDGGLSILLVVGAAYGARRFKNKKSAA